jgi:hypothetical protein
MKDKHTRKTTRTQYEKNNTEYNLSRWRRHSVEQIDTSLEDVDVLYNKEAFEDTPRVIKICKSKKDRKYNDQKFEETTMVIRRRKSKRQTTQLLTK